MKTVGVILKEGTESGALEPIPVVEVMGTEVLHAYLALLDGDHIRETADHAGTICKHRHFWLITEMVSISDHSENHSRELIFQFSFLLLTIILYLFIICKIRGSSDYKC